MQKNLDKRIPLNLDLAKLLEHFPEVPDTSEYEARRQARAQYKSEWARTHWEQCKKAKRKYNCSEKGRARAKAYAATYREQHNANNRVYRQRHLEELRKKARERYYLKKAEQNNTQ